MKGKNEFKLRDGRRQKLVTLSPADKGGVAAAKAYVLKARSSYTVQLTGTGVMQFQAGPDAQTTSHYHGVMAGPMKKMPVTR